MRLERNGCKPVDNPSLAQIRQSLNQLRSYGRSCFASLTDAAGNYVQVGGGKQSCVVEWQQGSQWRQRAHRRCGHAIRPDGTLLEFGQYSFAMQSDEWMGIDKVIEIFDAFARGADWPEDVFWRDSPV